MKITKEQCEFERFLLVSSKSRDVVEETRITTVDLMTFFHLPYLQDTSTPWAAFIRFLFPSQDQTARPTML